MDEGEIAKKLREENEQLKCENELSDEKSTKDKRHVGSGTYVQ